jgi:aminoglycoside phosphotransferase (APT) family kinase protein
MESGMKETAAYLKTILLALRNDLVPELTSDMAKHRAELIDFILTRLVAQMSAPAAWRDRYWRDIKQSFENANVAFPEMTPDDGANLENPERQLSESLKAILADVVQARKEPRLAKAALETLTRGVALAETEYRNRFETLVQSESRTAPLARTERVESKMTAENITGYLRKRFTDAPDIRAAAVVPIPGGRSKGTILFTLEGHASLPREIVLRQDIDAEVGGLSVTYEYPLLEELWRDRFPVPQPLWSEERENELGGPFCAFAKAPGRPGGTLFRMDAPAEAARDAAKFFARLHSVDIDATGLRDKLRWGRSQTPVRDMLDFNYAKWKASEVEPSALIETSFIWLYDHLGAIDPKAVLVHGDSSYHNMLIHEDRLSVVLDWEFAHAGDAAEDLLGSQHFTIQVLPWQEFIDVYRENGGREISRERFQFFALWRSLRFAIATAAAGHVFTSGVNRDLRVAAIGHNSYPRLLQDVARQLAAMD